MNRELGLILALATCSAPVLAAGPAQSNAPQSANAQACAKLKALGEQERAEIPAMNARIKQAHQDFEAKIKALEEERKAAEDRYNSERDGLLEQVAPGAVSEKEAFQQKIKQLNEQEQQEVKSVREKYSAQRKALVPPKQKWNCK